MAKARVWANTRLTKDTSTWKVVVVDGPLGVDDAVAGHAGYKLEGITPNPASGRTEIAYRLGAAGRVTIAIYNAAGEEVASLPVGTQSVGEHAVTWDATGLPSGVYYCRISAGGWNASLPVEVAR